ncbi:Hypothetical predicted protein, partial [Marmota monax]
MGEGQGGASPMSPPLSSPGSTCQLVLASYGPELSPASESWDTGLQPPTFEEGGK